MSDRLTDFGLELHSYESLVAESLPYVEQLIKKSRQPHILATTPRDVDRFKDIASVYKRFDTGQLAIMLINKTDNDLAGMAWFRPAKHAQVPQANLTYAHRLYEGYLGKGLSTPFAKAAHDIALNLFGATGIWLVTDASNDRAISTYESVGYIPVEQNAGRIVMSLILVSHEPAS